MSPCLPVKVAGLGYYLPERIVTSAELEAQLGLAPGWIERVAGVRERRYVTHETSAGMAAMAAQRALDAAGIAVADVDAIIGASTAPQQMIPCTAAFVQRELGAPGGGSACFDVNATCLSFLFALHNAAYLVAAGAYQNVLIYSSEITSYSLNAQEHESTVLFGDAAAAALVTRAAAGESSAVWHARFRTYASGADLTELIGGGTRQHPNHPTTTPEMNMFHMNGPEVFRQAVRLIGLFLDTFFADLGWTRGDVDVLIPHQASGHGIQQLTKQRMGGFRPEQVFVNLPVRGNCIAASIPLAFAEAVEAGRIRRGYKVLLAGTGAGLTLGALALTY